MPIPSRLLVTIGGFGGPHYEVRWFRRKLRYHSDELQAAMVPTDEAWKSFWAALDRINVWGWAAHYDDLEIFDGTQWELDLSDGVRRVRCSGSNAYPPEFQQFLDAVTVLTGQRFGT